MLSADCKFVKNALTSGSLFIINGGVFMYVLRFEYFIRMLSDFWTLKFLKNARTWRSLFVNNKTVHADPSLRVNLRELC